VGRFRSSAIGSESPDRCSIASICTSKFPRWNTAISRARARKKILRRSAIGWAVRERGSRTAFVPTRKSTAMREWVRTGRDALPFCKATLLGVRCPHGPYFTQVKGYPSDPKTIGEAIRKRRLDLGLRQIDVASELGCNEMTVVNWEKGYTNPRPDKIACVKRFLASFKPLSTEQRNF
jgi:DNA-binding XRE family transcriptional regulator